MPTKHLPNHQSHDLDCGAVLWDGKGAYEEDTALNDILDTDGSVDEES